MSPRPRIWVLALAATIAAAMLLLGLFVGDRDEPGAVVYAPAVALVALELGAFAGVASAVAATAFFAVARSEVNGWDLTVRAAALIALGALVGALGTRLREARRASRTAGEINDNVIQGLVLAKYAVERGDTGEAAARIDATLDEAHAIVDRLVDAERVRPGDLRRESPARVR